MTENSLNILDLMSDDSLVQNVPGPFKKKDPSNKVNKLLSQCLHRDKRTSVKAERAMEIIRKNNLVGFDFYRRGLVYFPHLLNEFLKIHRARGVIISDDDMASMFSRCIESRIDESMDILLEHHGNRDLEIKLLPGKYPIDEVLYQKAKTHNIIDKYYDAALEGMSIPYAHPDIIIKTNTDFRDAYHILLYGDNKHLQSLIVRWDLWGDDSTTEAAREFFGLPFGASIESAKHCVNKRCCYR